MKNFLIGWMTYQLVFIGLLLPFVWNANVGMDACNKPIETMKPMTQLIITTVPLFWFLPDQICK